MKIIAWNVDTQYDFMSPSGKLYVKGAEEIEPNLEKLTKYFRNNGITIVNTADCHDAESEEISGEPDYVNTFGEHCMRKTAGAEYIPATKPIDPYIIDWKDKTVNLEKLLASKEIVLLKDKFDVFQGTPHADEVLHALAPNSVIVYGVASNVCVDYAVKGLLIRGMQVYVVEDAIKGLPNMLSPVENWKQMDVKIIHTDELCR
jgi:nicotinamidase/pyrazinamidase